MIHEQSIDVDAPPDVVWAVMTDVEKWPEWTESVTSVVLLDAGPLALGSRARIKQPRVPAVVWRVTAIDPGRSFTWEAKTPGALSSAHHVVTPNARGGSTVTLTVEQRGWLVPVFAPWIRPMTRRYVAMEAEGLKRRSEAAARS